jgi:hypothetical protein
VVDEAPPPEGAPAPALGPDPFEGFDVQVLVDRPIYASGETVRITVTATNHGPRPVEHHYPGWQRYHLSIRDEWHRVVADDEVHRAADTPAVDRWLPGQMVIQPTYWGQTAGPVVPAWTDEPPGARVAPGRYRVRVTWLGRVPGERAQLPDAWSRWFELR